MKAAEKLPALQALCQEAGIDLPEVTNCTDDSVPDGLFTRGSHGLNCGDYGIEDFKNSLQLIGFLIGLEAMHNAGILEQAMDISDNGRRNEEALAMLMKALGS